MAFRLTFLPLHVEVVVFELGLQTRTLLKSRELSQRSRAERCGQQRLLGKNTQ